jgi:hypothetical protein
MLGPFVTIGDQREDGLRQAHARRVDARHEVEGRPHDSDL